MTEQQKIDAISRVVSNQFEDTQRMLNDALEDSSIGSEYYGEIKGMVRYFMAVALQQREERDAIYKQLVRNDSEIHPLP